jgi:hypothetical protein
MALEKQQVLHIGSLCLQPYLSSMKSACVVLYYHLWLLRFCHIFPHCLLGGTIFGINFLNVKYVF